MLHGWIASEQTSYVYICQDSSVQSVVFYYTKPDFKKKASVIYLNVMLASIL